MMTNGNINIPHIQLDDGFHGMRNIPVRDIVSFHQDEFGNTTIAIFNPELDLAILDNATPESFHEKIRSLPNAEKFIALTEEKTGDKRYVRINNIKGFEATKNGAQVTYSQRHPCEATQGYPFKNLSNCDRITPDFVRETPAVIAQLINQEILRVATPTTSSFSDAAKPKPPESNDTMRERDIGRGPGENECGSFYRGSSRERDRGFER